MRWTSSALRWWATATARRLPCWRPHATLQRVVGVLAESPHVAVEVPRCPAAIEQFVAELAASPALQASLARNHGARAGQVVQRWRERWCDPVFWAWDVSDELAQVRCPVLVVHGAADPYFSVQHSAMVAECTQGELIVFPSVGHSPHVEAPDLFEPAPARFLAARTLAAEMTFLPQKCHF